MFGFIAFVASIYVCSVTGNTDYVVASIAVPGVLNGLAILAAQQKSFYSGCLLQIAGEGSAIALCIAMYQFYASYCGGWEILGRCIGG